MVIRNIYKYVIKSGLFLLTSLLFLFSCQGVFAQIAIFNSNTNANIYSAKHLGNYSDLFQEIVYTFSNTNIKYNIISENELNNINVKDFNVIVLPLVVDLPQESYVELTNYIKEGGKVIIILPDAWASPTVQKLTDLIGVQPGQPRRILYKAYVNLPDNFKAGENDFPASTKMAAIKLPFAKSLALWDQNGDNATAIAVSDNGSYIGWRWGNDGNLSFNIAAVKAVLESLAPGIINREQSKLDFKNFGEKIDEIEKFKHDAKEFIESSEKSESSKSDSFRMLADIQEHLYISKMQENLARSYYQNCEYEKAQSELKKAKINAMYAYAKAIPSSIVEGRTLWLDRGTIVTIKNPEDMANLFDKIQKIGINMVYFETVNAGYSIYPGKIIEQNPLTAGWDPLYWAIHEAHKRNIELHAWTWIFAVGNTKHNPIIGKSYDYPGPIISKNPDLALQGVSGNLLLTSQHEYWMDPSNPKARQLALSILEEIAANYQVDGIQLDYIRYPFQKGNSMMGFDTDGKQKFEIETGYKLDKPDNATIKVWNTWKTKQISRFVQEASCKLRKIRPGIRISAAVFGGTRQSRLDTIQQDWETWVEKGWIDILNPMIYAPTTLKLAENLDYINRQVGSKALVYPGIAVRQLEVDDLLEQIYTIKNAGLMGNTIFAMAHLGPEKSELLAIGPYRFKEARVPSKNPLNSVRALLEEFLYRVDGLKQNNSLTSGSYQYEGDMIIVEAGKIHTYILSIISKPSVAEISKAILMLQNLELMTQKWLTIENGQNSVKMKFLTDYLKEAEILLSYEQHKVEPLKY